MYPERRGQAAGPLDWKIVALDAIGLLLFFVPGVVAFAVDFSNGTIYLPPDHYGDKRRNDPNREFVSLKIPKEDVCRSDIEKTVSMHLKREIRLLPGAYQTHELKNLQEFWATREKLAAS